jgi:hypothetical protein
MKYALYREDYMNELFPNGYTKPIIMSSKVSFDSNNQNAFFLFFIKEPIERRVRKTRLPVYWSRRSIIK